MRENREERSLRDLRARTWREARGVAARLPAEARRDLMGKWRRSAWPRNAAFFRAFVGKYLECGLVYLDRPTRLAVFNLVGSFNPQMATSDSYHEATFNPVEVSDAIQLLDTRA